jgi:hypothetical protein
MPQGQSQSTNFEVGETVLHKVILVVAPDFVALATFTASNRALTVRAVYKQHGSWVRRAIACNAYGPYWALALHAWWACGRLWAGV